MASKRTAGKARTTSTLTDRQVQLLGSFEVEGSLAKYAGGDRVPDWAAVKEVFLRLGATWSRVAQAFVWPAGVDAQGLVEQALETREVVDPRAAGFFPTPPALAERVARLANLKPNHRVLEPSAGRGAHPSEATNGDEADPSTLLIVAEDAKPDWVMTPPELGSRSLRVKALHQRPCFLCEQQGLPAPPVRHLETGAGLSVLECPTHRICWYTMGNSEVRGG